MKNTRFGITSLHGKGNVVLQGIAHIADEVFCNLLLMYKIDGKSFSQHLGTTYRSHPTFSAKVNPQIVHKMPQFG